MASLPRKLFPSTVLLLLDVGCRFCCCSYYSSGHDGDVTVDHNGAVD